jgi:hypothetical protein
VLTWCLPRGDGPRSPSSHHRLLGFGAILEGPAGRPFQPPEPRPIHHDNKILHQSEVSGKDLRRSQLQSMKAGGEVEVVVAEGESEDE